MKGYFEPGPKNKKLPIDPDRVYLLKSKLNFCYFG